MKYKIILFLICFSFLSINTLWAQDIQLTDEDGMTYSDSSSICANQEYTLTTDSEYSQILIVDSVTNTILQVYNTNSEISTIELPENAGDVQLVVTSYDNDGKLDDSSEQRLNYSVSDCGNKKEVDNYKVKQPTAIFSYEDGELTVSGDTTDDYEFDYKFVDDSYGRKKKLDSDKPIDMEGHDILQFTETKDDKTKYYELDLNKEKNTFVIRPVESFELRKIDTVNLFKPWQVILLLFFIICYIYISKVQKKKKRNFERLKQRSEERRRKYEK